MILCSRLLGSSPAVYSDKNGGRLDFFGSSGADNGAGQLEYGLCKCQEPAGYARLNYGIINKGTFPFKLNNVLTFLVPIFLISFCLSAYKWIHGELKGNVALQYLAWVTYPMILVVFASLFCHLVSPQAIGRLFF